MTCAEVSEPYRQLKANTVERRTDMILLDKLSSRNIAKHLHPRGKKRILWLDVMIDGDRIRESMKTNDKREATLRATEYLRRRRENQLRGMTLSELGVKFHDYNESKNSSGYTVNSDTVFRRLIDLVGDVELDDVDRPMVERFRIHSSKTSSRYGRPLSGSTINTYMILMRSAFSYAVYNNWVSTNPFSRFIRSTAEEHAPNIFKPELMRKILLVSGRTAEDFDKLIELYLMTGMRRGELVKLEWSNVDYENRVISLRAATTKKKRDRTIPLNKRSIQILNYLQTRYDRPCPYSGDQIEYLFSKVRKEVGFNGKLHDLRKTCNSWLKAYAKLPDSYCELILGHRNPHNTNFTFYTGYIEDAVYEALEKLTEVLYPPVNTGDVREWNSQAEDSYGSQEVVCKSTTEPERSAA
jgi:integrase